jgi:hypothetical protein
MKFKLYTKRFIPLIYFLAVSLPHYPFSNWLDNNILRPYGFQVLQESGDILAILILVVLILLGYKVIRNYGRQSIKYFGIWIAVIILMAGADRILIVNNIERIHFPQYMVLALLLGWSLRNESLIFFVTFFAGFLDEFRQYVIAPDRDNYLDFNDITLNVLGAALGVAMLMSLRSSCSIERDKYEERFNKIFKSCVSAVAVLVVVMLVSGRFVLLSEQVKPRDVLPSVDGKLSFVLSFERHDQFWQHSPAHGKAFHVFDPFEGLTILFLLSVFTWWWIKWLKQEKRINEKGKRAG